MTEASGAIEKRPLKRYPTIGCCGIDCGLCPRYYANGKSRCPGCCGPGFFEVTPGCSFITCCVRQKGLEVCGQCKEYSCDKSQRLKADGPDAYDSAVTHRKALPNLDFIKGRGLAAFLAQQQERIKLLETFLREYDDGRSKSFYCLAAALLPIAELMASLAGARLEISVLGIPATDVKRKAAILRTRLKMSAQQQEIELILRRKTKANGRK